MNKQVVLVGAAVALLAGCENSKYGRNTNNEPAVTDANPRATYSGSSSTSNQQNQSTLRAIDSDFLREAYNGSLKEIQLGRLAVKQAQNDKVREFGQRMINDHTRMNDELGQLARNKGLTLSAEIPSQVQNDVGRFSNMNVADFDRQYVRQMIQDHERAADAFDRQARTGDDASVRSLAARSLPTIREHLRIAKDLEQNMTAPAIGGQPLNPPRTSPANPPPAPTPTPDNPAPMNPNPPKQPNPNNPDNPSELPPGSPRQPR